MDTLTLDPLKARPRATWAPGDHPLLAAGSPPCGEAMFDAVLSSARSIFAVDHWIAVDDAVADVPAGAPVSLLAWTPSGFVGRLFAALDAYAPVPAPMWGEERRIRGLLGHRIADLTVRHERLEVAAFASPEEFRDHIRSRVGSANAALDAAVADLARWYGRANGRCWVMEWEYLRVTGFRA